MRLIAKRRSVGSTLLPAIILFSFFLGSVWAANLGTVVPIVGQVTDLIYDAPRGLLYLANATRNQVEIYSTASRELVGSIPTGLQPASLAFSPDGQTLYVASIGSNTLTVINLNFQQAVGEYAVGSRPDSIAVGNDGQVVILGTAGLVRFDPATGQFLRLAISPPPTPPIGLPGIPASPVPGGFLAGLVASASGNLIIGLSTNRLFVYEVASGTVLRSRNVTGLRAILSVSPDGSRFMAGPFLFDTQTLAVLGRAGTPAATLTGGSAFSVDGNSVYATFSTQPPINPLNTNNPQNQGGATLPGGVQGPGGGGGLPPGVVLPPGVIILPPGGGGGGQQPGGGGFQPPGGGLPAGGTGLTSVGTTRAVLQVMRASSLTPVLGLRLGETITSKIIAASDGQYLFAISTSGLLVLPFGQLNNIPILEVDTTNVVLSVDICNRSVATASVQVRNAGGGRMTFAATVNNQNAPVILNVRSGLAPSTLEISFDPRRVTARGTQQFAVILVSPEAVNIEPAILVNLNFRDVDQRGLIVPMRGVGVDLQMDEARQRLYVANYTEDQIEVFSLAEQRFLPPIRVGNRPLSMALVDSTTLVVANSGGETISVVDLNGMQEIDQIPLAPVPLNAVPLFPRSIAASSNAILFSVVPLPATTGAALANGSVWQLSLRSRSAFPRLNLGGTTNNVIQGRNLLVAPTNGSAIVIAEANGTLRLYDPVSDTFAATRPASVTGFRGTASAAADGSLYLVDNFVFNSVLAPQGTIAPTTVVGGGGQAAQQTLAFGVAAMGGSALRIQAAIPTVPVQRLQRYNLANLQPDLEIRLPESAMDISPAAIGTANGTRQWPPRSVALELGINNQTHLLRRGVAVDQSGNAYLLTFSGLSVVSFAPTRGRGPSFRGDGVVNAASFRGPVAPGSLIGIFGSDLAEPGTADQLPLPQSLGGVCVTINETPIPLLYTSPTQINAQVPSDLAAGRVTVAVRSTRLGQTSSGVSIQVSAAAPGVFFEQVGGEKRSLLFHAEDFRPVTPDNPGKRDKDLILYVTGLGPVSPPVPSGTAARAAPLSATTQRVSVVIGGHEMIVTFAGLAPGFVGLYQINLRVPGDRVQGDDLPVVVSAGGLSSSIADAPLASIH